MKSRVKIDRGTGNVFEDVGFSPAEAENLQLRAQLMWRIRAEARDMTQAQSAKLFGVTQRGSMTCCAGRSTSAVRMRS
jgi:predicted XRE-type DNA-binding protein